MYKIIAIDMDGTTIDSNCNIPEENMEALQKASEMGAHIVIASGRCIITLRDFAVELGIAKDKYHIITLNGAAVYDGFDRQILEIRMSKALSAYVLDKLRGYDTTVIAYNESDEMYVKLPKNKDRTGIDNYLPYSLANVIFTDNLCENLDVDLYKILIRGEFEQLRDFEIKMKEKAADMEYGMFLSSDYLLEFTHKNSNKGHALDFICKKLGLNTAKEAIAIGDSFNDISMIKAAALGVCMRNGKDGVKAYADYITEKTNEECGVAEVLNKFVFQ